MRTTTTRSRKRDVSTGEPIVYRIAMENAGDHEFAVEMRVPALPDRPAVELVFPAWAPGSYMIRDFVRHVYELTITDARGAALPAERLDKQRWRSTNNGGASPPAVPPS
jgi:predicted metalloprotease with PDZ domain